MNRTNGNYYGICIEYWPELDRISSSFCDALDLRLLLACCLPMALISPPTVFGLANEARGVSDEHLVDVDLCECLIHRRRLHAIVHRG